MSSGQYDKAETSPFMLIREIETLAKNEVPACLDEYCRRTGLKPWQLLEEAAYQFFRTVLMLNTHRMGAEALFEHEPEGLVLSAQSNPPLALLYECKARKDGYKVESDEGLRYCDYIRDKRKVVRVRHSLELTHFCIIAPSFGGDTEARIQHIEQEGVVVSFVPAELLSAVAAHADGLTWADVQLVNLAKLFPRGVLGTNHIEAAFPLA